MLKRLLFTLLCVYTTSLAEKLEWKNLDEEQIEVAKKVYEIAKESDLAETMIAISWQESRLGKIPINLSDKSSCGVQHVHIKTYMWMNNIKDTPLNRNLYCSNLIKDVELSTNAAIKYFLYAKKRHKGNHEKAIKSYNGGFDLKRVEKAVNEYYKNVRSYMSDAKEIINKIKEI